MTEVQPGHHSDMQEQIDELSSRADAADQRALESESRADKSELRADNSAIRADAVEVRTDAEDVKRRDDRRRIGEAERRLDVHEEMITELQTEGLITSAQAAHLENALQTARTIGAAVGIVMALYRVSEAKAFELLKKASTDTNRKLRVLADEVVLTGDAPGLPPR